MLNGWKRGHCSGKRPGIWSWSIRSWHIHDRGARSCKWVSFLPLLAVDVPHTVPATGCCRQWRGSNCNSTRLELGCWEAERGRRGQRHANGRARWTRQLELRTTPGPTTRLRQRQILATLGQYAPSAPPKCKASSFSSWTGPNFRFCGLVSCYVSYLVDFCFIEGWGPVILPF
jgi:hypothetical protein